jgi:hypothetical protein
MGGYMNKGGKYNRERVSSKEVSSMFVSEYIMNSISHKIVMVVYSMTAMNVLQLAKVLKVEPSTIRNATRKLYDNRFLDRRFELVEYGNGSGKAIYFLDEAGKIYVSGILGIKVNEVRWKKSENLLHSNNLNHTLGLCDIRAALSEKIYEWQSGKELGWFEFKIEKEDFVFAPDAFVSIEEGDFLFNYFIEYDRTMRSKEFVKKIKNYEAYKRSGNYHEDGFSTYPRVLVITTSERKVRYISELIETKMKEDIKYYLVSFEQFLKNPIKGLINKITNKSVIII